MLMEVCPMFLLHKPKSYNNNNINQNGNILIKTLDETKLRQVFFCFLKKTLQLNCG